MHAQENTADTGRHIDTCQLTAGLHAHGILVLARACPAFGVAPAAFGPSPLCAKPAAVTAAVQASRCVTQGQPGRFGEELLSRELAGEQLRAAASRAERSRRLCFLFDSFSAFCHRSCSCHRWPSSRCRSSARRAAPRAHLSRSQPLRAR